MAKETQRAVVDIKVAADYLGISLTKAYKLVQQGKMPGKRIGERWRFKMIELEQFASSVVMSDTDNRGASNEQIQAGNS